MKVLQLSTSFPTGPGSSAGVFVLDLARSLKLKGVQVDVAAPHAPGIALEEEIENVNVRRLVYFLPKGLQRLCYGAGMPENIKQSSLAKIQLPLLGAAFLAHALKNASKYDIIHAHWNLAGLAAVITGKITNIPVVVNMHHGHSPGQITRMDRFVLENSDFVVCNSHYTLELLLNTCRPKRYGVISPGVDTELFSPAGENKHPQKSVFAMGRFIEWKGFRYLIEAIGLIKEELPDARLKIVGDGPLKADLEKQIEQTGLNSTVFLLGKTPHDKTPCLFREAAVFVLPSIIDSRGNTEGLGLVLAEAMACGIPCVASNVGGIPDIVKHGENGFLVEPADPKALASAISTLLKNDDLRRKMGQNARKFAKREFSWQSKAVLTIEMYQDLISAKKGSPSKGQPGLG